MITHKTPHIELNIFTLVPLKYNTNLFETQQKYAINFTHNKNRINGISKILNNLFLITNKKLFGNTEVIIAGGFLHSVKSVVLKRNWFLNNNYMLPKIDMQ